jgi:hypothetical protein
MDVSVESLKLRKMRVHNEISFSAEAGMTAEDLAALREELRNLDRKINEKINEMSTSRVLMKGLNHELGLVG